MNDNTQHNNKTDYIVLLDNLNNLTLYGNTVSIIGMESFSPSINGMFSKIGKNILKHFTELSTSLNNHLVRNPEFYLTTKNVTKANNRLKKISEKVDFNKICFLEIPIQQGLYGEQLYIGKKLVNILQPIMPIVEENLSNTLKIVSKMYADKEFTKSFSLLSKNIVDDKKIVKNTKNKIGEIINTEVLKDVAKLGDVYNNMLAIHETGQLVENKLNKLLTKINVYDMNDQVNELTGILEELIPLFEDESYNVTKASLNSMSEAIDNTAELVTLTTTLYFMATRFIESYIATVKKIEDNY